MSLLSAPPNPLMPSSHTQVSFGERMSVRIVAARLNQIGVPAMSFESWQLGLRTTSQFGGADVITDCYADIKRLLGKLDPNV